VYVSALVSEERVAVVVSDVVTVTPNLSLFIPGVEAEPPPPLPPITTLMSSPQINLYTRSTASKIIQH